MYISFPNCFILNMQKPMENTPGEIVLIEAYGINNNNTDLEIGQLLQQCKILLPKPKRLKRKLFSENCETSKNVKNIERINTNCPQRLQRSPRMNEESQKSVFIMSTDDDISKHVSDQSWGKCMINLGVNAYKVIL